MTALTFAIPFDGLSLGISFLVTMTAFSLLWLLSLKWNDSGIVDYYWGLGFPVIGWITLGLTGNTSFAAVLIALAVTIWAVRLTLHMVVRHIRAGVEDPRYAKMRAAGGPDFKRRSLFYIFWLQAVLLWLIAAPVHALATPLLSMGPLFWFGMALFLIGFGIETMADWQLMRFRNQPLNKGRLMTAGLFAWSRHPNYFGEILLWWGLAFAVFAASGSPYVFIGPALLTLILLKVSGPPMLADHLKSRAGYADWIATTRSVLIWPPKKPVRVPSPAE
jgi:steroid 5-alpha reductase family enzyme